MTNRPTVSDGCVEHTGCHGNCQTCPFLNLALRMLLNPRRLYSHRRRIERSVVSVCVSVCLSVCLSVCPRSKRKTAGAMNTKHDRPIKPMAGPRRATVLQRNRLNGCVASVINLLKNTNYIVPTVIVFLR